MTQDLDVVVDPEQLEERLQSFVEKLAQSDFLFDAASIRDAVRWRGMFQLLDRIEAMKIDLYAREMIPGELSRSESVELFPGESYPLVSFADAAVSKLVWIGKGSHKSRRDLRHLYGVADAEKRAAIEQGAATMQLPSLLRKVLGESDEVEP